MVKLTKYRNNVRREGWIFRRDGGGKMDGATLYIKQLKPYLYLLDEEQPRSLRNTYDRGMV